MRHVFAAVGLIGMAATTLEGSAVLRLVEDTHTTQPAPQAAAQGSWTADARSGWTDDTGQRRWQFNLQDDRGDSHWGFGIRPSEIEGMPAAAAADGTASDVAFATIFGSVQWTMPRISIRADGDALNGIVEPFRHDYAVSTDCAGNEPDEGVAQLHGPAGVPTAAYTGPQVTDV